MNTNTDFDKIDNVLSKNGGGLSSAWFCIHYRTSIKSHQNLSSNIVVVRFIVYLCRG